MSQVFKNFGKLRDTHLQMTVCLCLRNLADTSGEVAYFVPAYPNHISFQPIFFCDLMHKKHLVSESTRCYLLQECCSKVGAGAERKDTIVYVNAFIFFVLLSLPNISWMSFFWGGRTCL